MENLVHKEFNLYHDMQARTNGEIYIGVVGPVRTGKSTFIKRFMDLLVIPNIVSQADKIRANDELPQSSAGKTIMTTEPKFIPKDAVEIALDSLNVKVRMIDCVGFMVNGAAGHLENDEERMVKTPWDTSPMPFTKAAEIGTEKVIRDHSTVGIVITGDGSFGDFTSEDYAEPEAKTVKRLKEIGKPFVMLLNSTNPRSEKTREKAGKLAEKYGCRVLPTDCQNLNMEDIHQIFSALLNEFPMREIRFEIPKWAQMLPEDDEIRQSLISLAFSIMKDINTMEEAKQYHFGEVPSFVESIRVGTVDSSCGSMVIDIKIENKFYFEMLSNMCGETIENEYQLVTLIKELTQRKMEFEKVSDAVSMVHINGYGVVNPTREQIHMEEPVVIKNGSKFGVRIKAEATTIYMIQTNIQTEIAPIVGNEQQANDLIKYINDNAADNAEGIWDINIFGKTIEQIVTDGIGDKIRNITEDNMTKLRDTLQKVMNDNTGIVCLIV